MQFKQNCGYDFDDRKFSTSKEAASRSNFVFAQALTLDLAVKIIIVTTLHYKYDNRCGCYCCNYCYNVEVIFAITTTTAAVVDNHFNCCCK